MATVVSYRLLTLIVAGTLALNACQSHPSQDFRFGTRITDDGYKQFQLVFPRTAQELRLPGSRQNRDQRDHGINQREVLSALEQILQDNGYCREGYMLLGRYAGETSNRVRGECRDKANRMDREAHPDTIEQW